MDSHQAARPKTFSGRHASQLTFELDGLIGLLKSRNVTSYFELGAREGDTFHAVMSALPVGSRGVALDLPGGLWGKSTTGKQLINAVKDLKAKNYDVNYILGDSRDIETISHIKELGPFDAALIDGDHTLKGVTADWENYKDIADIIAFHDIVGTGQKERVHSRPVEVPVLWDQLKKEYHYAEFIAPGSSMGIGCVLKS